MVSISMRLLRAVLLPLLCAAGLGVAQDDGVFYNPASTGVANDYSNSPVYEIGETVQIRWTVSWERISLTLWQNGNNNFEYLLPNVSNPNNYDWLVSTDKDYSNQDTANNGSTFFLVIFNPGTNDQFSSHYFNLTNDSSDPQSATTTTPATSSPTDVVVLTVTPSPSSSATTSTTSSSNSNATPLAVASNSPSPDADTASGGLSPSAKTGLGVGIGIGVPALVLLGVAVGFCLRSRSRNSHAPAIPYGAVGPAPVEKYSDQKIQPQVPRMGMQELPAESEGGVYELAGEEERARKR